jgi:hypothetical protein
VGAFVHFANRHFLRPIYVKTFADMTSRMLFALIVLACIALIAAFVLGSEAGRRRCCQLLPPDADRSACQTSFADHVLAPVRAVGLFAVSVGEDVLRMFRRALHEL